jgi:hypothetical protein
MHSRQPTIPWNRRTALAVAGLFALGLSLAEAAQQEGKADTTPANTDARTLSTLIDRSVDAQLKAEKVDVSPRTDDATFLRRVYLDITGQIPSAEKAVAFLDSQDTDKRAKLIDELLASPAYGKHQADLWQPLLLARNSDNRRLQTQPMHTWLEKNFNENKPWNKMVHELLTASGDQDKNGAVTYYLSLATVDKMTDSVTKVFLGLQLQCAQCHNHPFTGWKQTQYWEMAAFFMKVQANPPRGQQTTTPTVTETNTPRRGRNALPESAKRLPPKFLQGDAPKVGSSDPLRPVLADWLTTAKNPYFSKAMVNRTWHQFFGRGLVNPVDDMHDANTPSHPELLTGLAEQFSSNGFDLKQLIRGICNSQAYQRSSRPTGNNAEATTTLYSHMPVKVLPPGELFDALTTVLGSANRGQAGRRPMGAGGRGAGGSPRDQFIAFFNLDENVDPTEYQAGIPQALRLMNGAQNNNGATARARSIAREAKTPEKAIETLFLTTLSRRPTKAETEKMTTYIRKQSDAEKAYADILWVLVNTSEFMLNR